jgi:5-methylthioadenosine/S-adenosylhomocysteine deaminase
VIFQGGNKPIMLFKNITILDEDFIPRENMYVGIKGEIIDYIGNVEPEIDYGESYDGQGKLLMSGFYNAHAHTPNAIMNKQGAALTALAFCIG